jgi:RNA polymerase sigma-70 factor, ECF subfamily
MELEELFLSKMPQFYRAAARVLQNPQDSEDALQNGLLSAYLHLDQFQGRSCLSTWVHSIVANAARMQLRKRRRSRTTSIDDDITNEDGGWSDDLLRDPHPNPEEECAREEQSRMLRDNMKHLSPSYRTVIQMCIIEGLLRREAAKKLGVPPGTVKARLHRACALLAKRAQV